MAVWAPEVIQAYLWHRKLAVSVQSSTALTFAVPENFVPPKFPPDLNFWEHVWVSNASTVKITFQFSHTGFEDLIPLHDFVAWLSADLLEWKLWEELGLEVVLEDRTLHAQVITESWKLVLNLGPRQRKTSAGPWHPGQQLLEHTDPCGIPKLTLKELKFTLTCEIDEPPRKRMKPTISERCDAFQPLLELDDIVRDQPLHAIAPLEDSTSKAPGFESFGHVEDTYSPSLYHGNALDQSPQEDMLLSEDDANEQKARKHRRTATAADIPLLAASYEAIVCIVDAVFRRAIVSKPHKVSPQIHYSLEHGPAYLVDIAPSMFCHGYAQAQTCAGRAPSISSIAASLTAILKRMRPASEQGNTWLRDGSANSTTYTLSEEQLQSKLWHISRAKVLGSGQARRLSALRCVAQSRSNQAEDADLLIGNEVPDAFANGEILLDDSGVSEDESGLCRPLSKEHGELQADSQDSGLGLDILFDGQHVSDLLVDEAFMLDENAAMAENLLLEQLLEI